MDKKLPKENLLLQHLNGVQDNHLVKQLMEMQELEISQKYST